MVVGLNCIDGRIFCHDVVFLSSVCSIADGDIGRWTSDIEKAIRAPTPALRDRGRFTVSWRWFLREVI